MTETLFDQGADLSLGSASDRLSLQIATLGPAGTSSEAAAGALRGELLSRGHDSVDVELCESYEGAAERVLGGSSDYLVVANAYANVSEFYMNPKFELAAVFVKDTPDYGLAVLKPVAADAAFTVATHPAPIPLITQLLPAGMSVAEVVRETSTSAAARAVKVGRVDVALTTAPAAKHYGLTFMSWTRPIRMLWSVFGCGPGDFERPAEAAR